MNKEKSTNDDQRRDKIKSKNRNHKPDYIFSIVVNVLLIFIFGKLDGWISFINQSFNAVLWLFYISFFASIIINLVYLFFDSPWFKFTTQLIINIFSSIIIYTLYIVFPFDLNEVNINIAKIVLIILLFAIVISIIVEFVKLLLSIIKICSGEGGNEK